MSVCACTHTHAHACAHAHVHSGTGVLAKVCFKTPAAQTRLAQGGHCHPLPVSGCAALPSPHLLGERPP